MEIDRVDSNETKLAKRNIESIQEIIEKNKEIIIFNRGYPSIELFNWLEKQEKKFVMRLSSNDYINEGKAIGIFKEKYIKIMLIKDKRKAIKELDLLEKEIEKYVSIVRKNRKSNIREWSPSNKYRINYKPSF